MAGGAEAGGGGGCLLPVAGRWEPGEDLRGEPGEGGSSVGLRGGQGTRRRGQWEESSLAGPSPSRSSGSPHPLPWAGGHPGDGRAILGPLGAPGHRDHQRQWPDHIQRAAAPAPGSWGLPREDGCQVRRRLIPMALPAGPSGSGSLGAPSCGPVTVRGERGGQTGPPASFLLTPAPD